MPSILDIYKDEKPTLELYQRKFQTCEKDQKEFCVKKGIYR